MDRSTELLIALTSRALSAELPPLKARDVWSLLQSAADQGATPAKLFDTPAWEQWAAPGLREHTAARLNLRHGVAEYVDGLRLGGIWVSSPFEATWPGRMQERLGPASPVVLYGAGDAGLLAQDGIGIVGSRSLDHDGANAAADIANAVVGAGRAVVSGGARGADRIAMSKALVAGGCAVGVLAHPLARSMRDSSIAPALDDGHLCLVTPFKPDAGFSVGNAMARNKLIYALSQVTAVVASDKDVGGTWSGAVEALDREFGTVAVWRGPGEGPGNAALASRAGAIPFEAPEVLVKIAPRAARQTSLL